MESAVVARGILYHRTDLGRGTSEHAEWLALLHALDFAKELGETDVELLGDSVSVLNQAKGITRCRSPEAQRCLATFHDQARDFTRIRVRHIRRTQNLAGIALGRARQGLLPLPAPLIASCSEGPK